MVSITLTSGTSSVNQRPEFVSHDGVDAASDSNDFYSFFFDVEDQFLYADRSVQNIHSWPYGQIAAGRAGGDRVEFHTDGSYSIEIGGNVTHFTTGNPFRILSEDWYWPNLNNFGGAFADRVDLPAGAIVRFTVMVGIPGIWDWSDPDPNEIDVASVEITASDLAIDVSVDGLSENDETSPGLIMRVNQDDDNHDGREDRFVTDAESSQLFIDDDLVEFVVTLGFPPGVVPNGYFTLEFDASVINVWHEPDKSRPEHLASSRVTPHITQIPLDADASDLSFWIEAKDNGSTSVNVVLYAGTPALPIRSDRIDLRAWGLDLDIDGENDNGAGPSGNTEFEEELEESDYALGKLLIPNGWNGNLVPLTLRLAPDLDPESNDVLIRFDFDAVGQSGLVWLWNTNDIERINQPVAQGGNRIYANEAHRLGDLNYDPVTGEATVYLDARSVHPGTHDTKKQVEDNGKPVDHISATLLLSGPGGAGHSPWITDRVKYMVVGEDSFFHDMSDRSQVRASLASEGVYGAAAHLEPSDLPQFGLRKLTPEELRRLDVPDEAVLLIGTDIVPGLKTAVYRDYVRGGYWLAFAGTENLEDWINNALQGLGWDSEQYSAAMRIAFGVHESDHIQAAGMRITGHSLGGGLASAAYAATGIPADTFNAAGLHRQTLLDEMGMERYPDSLARYDAGGPGIRAWYLDWDILSLVQDNVAAMPSALGERFLMDGPFDSRISSATVTVAITSWLQVPVLSWAHAV